MQFLQTQASIPTSQTSNIKSKHTPDPEAFTREGFSIKQIYKCFKTFKISLNFKIILKLDRMLTSKARITYIISCISGIAQGYIAPKIQAKYY